jgi:hypothetical protein
VATPVAQPARWKCPRLKRHLSGGVERLRLGGVQCQKSKPPYPPEFRREAVELVRATAAPTRIHAELAWLGNDREYLIEPHVRPQVVEGYTEKMTPILRRLPVQQVFGSTLPR